MSRAAILLLVALAAPTAPSARDASPRGRFVIGAPDRLTMTGDRRHPRRYERVESAVGAYADVDEVVDTTWLRHEVEGYARRAVDCEVHPSDPCLRAVRRVGAATVIHLVDGGHAEMLWTSGRRAVRLGWRRLVATPTGTMTVDEPPADFTAALLAELPSDLDLVSLDDARPPAWAEEEIDRRLDYAERALDGCALAGDPAAAACLYFARAGLLAVEEAEGPGAGAPPEAAAAATVISVRLRLTAARMRRAAARQSALATPWCAAPPLLEPPQVARQP